MRRTLSALALSALTLGALSSPAPALAGDATPRLVRDISPGTTGSQPVDDDTAALGSRMVFSADDGAHGTEVWISDGTTSGTKQVRDIAPGAFSSSPKHFTAFQGRVWFTAEDTVHGRELWVTDGTTAGTGMVKDLWVGGDGSQPEQLTATGNMLFFTAVTPTWGHELWRTDGSAAGTGLVRDINQSGAAADSEINEIVALGDKVLFNAKPNDTVGNELWISDGTLVGTKLLNNLDPGAGASSLPSELTRVGSRVFFSASDILKGRELFVTDGTSLGTHRTADMYIGQLGSDPQDLVAYGSQVVLSAARAGEGREPWISDGTEDGTRPLADLYAGNLGSHPRDFTVFKGSVYFQAGSTSAGSEVWTTKGTHLTTALLKDIVPGPDGSEPGGFAVAGPVMIFSAYHPSAGSELWSSDGTSAGTKLLRDIHPGAGKSSFPVPMRVVGNTAFLTAEDAHGTELWAYTPGAASAGAKSASSTKGYSKVVRKKVDKKKKVYVTVKVWSAGKAATGTVTLKQGSQVLGHRTLSGGKAAVRITSRLGQGTHYLHAYYSGSGKAKPSMSGVLTVKVKRR